MSRKVSLTINKVPIKLDYFVEGYVYHLTGGIIASLKDTGPIKKLTLAINDSGEVKINLNGADVPCNEFVTKIIHATLAGMATTLKGVERELETLELKITA